MSAVNENEGYLPTDGAAVEAIVDDMEMVNVTAVNSTITTTTENIQMQQDVNIQSVDEKSTLQVDNVKSNTIVSGDSTCEVVDIASVITQNPNVAKTTRNIQTQHGDYRSVDAENIFLIPRCLWPEDEKKKYDLPSTSSDNNTDTAIEQEAEQVVWIEPFANEVRFNIANTSRNCATKISFFV